MDVQLQLSLTNIALLTGVKRPVVSMWRSRAAATNLPFPDAIGRVAGEERFDVDAVVNWIEATGRGLNRDVRADAAGFALPPHTSFRDEPHLFDGLTALLCLRVVSGSDLAAMSDRHLAELAAEFDQADVLLRREIEALGPRLTTMAAYADHLADATFGSAEAIDRLVQQRFKHGLVAESASAFARPLVALITNLATSLAREQGAEPPVYVDASGCGGELFLDAVLADAAQAPTVFATAEDTPSARLLLRRLRVHDVLVQPPPAELAHLPAAVVVAQFPPGDRPSMADDDVLDVVDELALSMSDEQRAVVIAPAGLLVDDLADRSTRHLRGKLLRTGRVRAMVRLPAGQVLQRPRQSLAVWVLGSRLDAYSSEQRRVAVADVSDESLTALLIGQIRDDVIAATYEPDLSRAHSFARSRFVTAASVIARRGALVAYRPQPTSSALSPASDALILDRLRRPRRAEHDALGELIVELGDAHAVSSILIGEAVREKALRVFPGNRLGFDPSATGTIPVLGVPELTAGVQHGTRLLDRLTFLGSYSSARLTEPYDVVFCTSPQPRAVVHAEGGAAVQYPARILRIDPVRAEGLSPHLIAQAINDQPARARAWRSWSVQRIPLHQAVPLSRAMAALAGERAAARARLDELDILQRTLLQGVARRAFSLHPPAPTTPPSDEK